MSTSIQDPIVLPDELASRLKLLAAKHGVSFDAEVALCIELGLSERELVEAKLTRIRTLHATMPNAWLTDELFREAKAERR